jgi:hypothetical protein
VHQTSRFSSCFPSVRCLSLFGRAVLSGIKYRAVSPWLGKFSYNGQSLGLRHAFLVAWFLKCLFISSPMSLPRYRPSARCWNRSITFFPSCWEVVARKLAQTAC